MPLCAHYSPRGRDHFPEPTFNSGVWTDKPLGLHFTKFVIYSPAGLRVIYARYPTAECCHPGKYRNDRGLSFRTVLFLLWLLNVGKSKMVGREAHLVFMPTFCDCYRG